MPTERAIRINQLTEANKPIINRVRSVCEQIAPNAIKSLSKLQETNYAIVSLTEGILHAPETIELRGMTLDLLEPEDRISVAATLNILSLPRFMAWHDENFYGQKSPSFVKKIVDRTMDHFVETWVEQNRGNFPEPDWQKLEETHEKVMSGEKKGLYEVYVALVNGVQTSTVEQFLEDTLPDEYFSFEHTTRH